MTDITIVRIIEPGPAGGRGPVGPTVAAVQALGNILGATEIDIAEGGVITATVTGAVAFSFTGAEAAGLNTTFMLVLTNPGAGAITWPASVDWGNDGEPDLPAAGRARLAFTSEDGGDSWDGVLSFLKSEA